ncbi:1,4-alpha-glucan branching protein GlgB [Clostridium sp.]|uniref:1,4-alpha-glucan branching protein GlgB n=1 Tax=Clostridium sp. TaxID=1506 RepID=UPI00321655DB
MKNNVCDQFIKDNDISLFIEGKNFHSYEFMGAHYREEEGIKGYRFTVWAPRCKEIRVVGNFNNWDGKNHSMEKISNHGIWSLFIKGIDCGELYKYEVISKDNYRVLKADPYSFYSQKRPNTASITVDSKKFKWGDSKWLKKRKKVDTLNSPMNVYEVHAGSFIKTDLEEFLDYREFGKVVLEHVEDMKYTHIEIMPIMEYPLDDSWGYQVTGYFSPTSRYGSGDDLKHFINNCHKKGIGVILDWVPGHFCKDNHGLYKFDGTCQYEYDDPLMYENTGWGTANFNLGKGEVRSFLISNAMYWIEEFHFDGLRIDAVSNMIFLDFNKEPGKWISNEYGGNENFKARDFLRDLNLQLYKKHKGIVTLAEESTATPYITSKENQDGLGFDLKWNMGWMNDTLKYMKLDREKKKDNHNLITFSMAYNHYEKFMLSISHDEVVYGKMSLLSKMPGDLWNKFSALRCFLAYMYCHPGKKTLFMGSEFGQINEWDFHRGIEFESLDNEIHKKTLNFTRSLNLFYKEESALWKLDYSNDGFQWIDADNKGQSVIIFMRKSYDVKDTLIVICNFTPTVYYDYKVGVPYNCSYQEALNTDKEEFGGAGEIIGDILFAKNEPFHNQENSITIKVPPMATLILKIHDGLNMKE